MAQKPLALLRHPKMSRYNNKIERIRKGQDIVKLKAPFTSYWEHHFKRTDETKQVVFKGEDRTATIYNYIKVQRK